MTVVLVAGAAGGLGHRTALAAARLPGTTVRGLVRTLSPSDPGKQKALEALKAAGVELAEGDLLQPGTLGPAVAGVDVVVSCVMGDEAAMVDGQANLLNAAKDAGFVASTFSMNLFALDPAVHFMIAPRRRFADILKDSGVPYLHISLGAFTEVFWGFFGLYCHEDGTLRYYGSPDQKLDVTTYQDTAEYTARAAIDPEATGILEFAGDQASEWSAVSINDVAAAYKEVYGKELPTKCLGSTADLAAEASRRFQADPSAWPMYIPLMYQRVMFDGSAKLHHVANNRYPDVHPTDMRSFLRQHPDLAAVAWWPGAPLPPEYYRK
ncbi:hypothetical protein CHLNCDRAFT_133246 [Chlorella variabilis]|uniref:NmrA-like domain-containing protein n=1 Tax=Chlorella variabilis TaxID=554065 RepID=E1Z2P4_CHLVA|nr:hypothetical protein CHLNCDRAFT_133246 [Chlorella variabilis]EFN60033.1 hypothetical protein CHLNCDRAFT_133246 [Chlorella variabilis]|eukprot:XP_005852135.1 hypothetical protein CHLNCDRAFT_133246 [Chlorella variabilis]